MPMAFVFINAEPGSEEEVLKELGKIGVPSEIEIVSSLPKTRSGKIMRRVLKAKELGQDPGDISTIEE